MLTPKNFKRSMQCFFHKKNQKTTNQYYPQYEPLTVTGPWKAIGSHLNLHLLAWQHAAHECETRKLLLFKIRPKHHALQHLGLDLARNRLNPRKIHSCWGDESFLGHLKKIGTRCHSVGMMGRMFQRYLLALGLRWRDSRG